MLKEARRITLDPATRGICEVRHGYGDVKNACATIAHVKVGFIDRAKERDPCARFVD